MLKNCVCLGLALLLAGCGTDRGSGVAGEVTTPRNWPIPELSLPAGAEDTDFSPGPLGEALDRVPRKRVIGSPPQPQRKPNTWNAFFRFQGESDKVFEHVRRSLEPLNYKVEEQQDLEVGTSNESRKHTYLSPDGRHRVSLRYWRHSEQGGSKPYQLLIQDLRANATGR